MLVEAKTAAIVKEIPLNSIVFSTSTFMFRRVNDTSAILGRERGWVELEMKLRGSFLVFSVQEFNARAWGLQALCPRFGA